MEVKNHAPFGYPLNRVLSSQIWYFSLLTPSLNCPVSTTRATIRTRGQQGREREREDVHTGSGGEDRRSGGPAILADCDPRCAAAHSAPPSAPTATCATPPPAYRFAVGPAKLYRCSIVTLLAPPCPVVPPHHPLRSHRLPFASRLESTRSDAYLAVLFFILFFPSRG